MNRKFKLRKGILIAIEGIDGAGKTTQAERLKEHFTRQGISVSKFKEPTDGFFGQKIKALAQNGRHTVTPEEELELFIKDRIEDCNNNIRPALERKELVIIDRYYFSSIAYQGALGLDLEYILKRNEEIAIIPDLVIILDVAVKIGLSRIKIFRKETHNHFEKEEYLEKVRRIFKKMDASYIQIIDGSKDEDAVFTHVRNIVQSIISPHSTIDDNQLDLFEKKKDKKILTFNNN